MNFPQGRKPCLPLGTKREEEREWREWEGVGKRGVNGNFYNLIKLLSKIYIYIYIKQFLSFDASTSGAIFLNTAV